MDPDPHRGDDDAGEREGHHRAGSTLSILRRQADSRWVLAQDANLLPE
jgi:hypothetical protein